MPRPRRTGPAESIDLTGRRDTDSCRYVSRCAADEDRQVGVDVEEDLLAGLTRDAVDLLTIGEGSWRCQVRRVGHRHALRAGRADGRERPKVSQAGERGEGQGGGVSVSFRVNPSTAVATTAAIPAATPIHLPPCERDLRVVGACGTRAGGRRVTGPSRAGPALAQAAPLIEECRATPAEQWVPAWRGRTPRPSVVGGWPARCPGECGQRAATDGGCHLGTVALSGEQVRIGLRSSGRPAAPRPGRRSRGTPSTGRRTRASARSRAGSRTP